MIEVDKLLEGETFFETGDWFWIFRIEKYELNRSSIKYIPEYMDIELIPNFTKLQTKEIFL